MRKMNKKGFTLVELMVVLAILGLLAGIGIPQYTKVMERARIGRDVAAIATVQTAVDAFVTETKWLENNNTGSTKLGDQVGNIEGTIKANSYLTGGEVALKDFFDENFKLPALESKDAEVAANKWYINKLGLVYVGTGTGGVILPGNVTP